MNVTVPASDRFDAEGAYRLADRVTVLEDRINLARDVVVELQAALAEAQRQIRVLSAVKANKRDLARA